MFGPGEANSPVTNQQTIDTQEPYQLPQPTIQLTHPMMTRGKAGIFKLKTYWITSDQTAQTLHIDVTLSNVQDALQDPNWQQAMNKEYHALIQNGTWSLIPYDSNMKVVGCKWVFKIKYNPNGSISRFKARLVAKGFHQTLGVDFSETYSPVVKAPIIRIVLSIAVCKNWVAKQIDVNNTFLNGDLSEDLFMVQPEGYEIKSKPTHVCKLNKAL